MNFLYQSTLLIHFIILFLSNKNTLLVSGCGLDLVDWTVTVVDSLTDEEVSVTTNEDVMTF